MIFTIGSTYFIPKQVNPKFLPLRMQQTHYLHVVYRHVLSSFAIETLYTARFGGNYGIRINV